MGRSGSVAIGDTEMYYVRFGQGRRNLVVIPGLSDGLATVKGKALFLSAPYRKFSKDFTVYMFSRKNKMPEGYSIADMADDQVMAMNKLGIGRASILGVSQGGMIAQMIAVRHPDVVDRLVLAVTAPYANDTAREAVTGWIGMAQRGDHKALMIDTAEKMYSYAYLRRNRKFFPLLVRFTKPKTYERFMRNAEAILGFDARNRLGEIKCPTLIIAGDDDNTVGNDAPQEFGSAIEDCSVYIYHGLGHGVHEESRDFYDRVLEFIRR